MKISLTDFVEFLALSGGKKLTKVRELKARKPYKPSADFYKLIRDKIILIHQNTGVVIDIADAIDETKDTTKKKYYRKIFAGYKKFWGRKKLEWFTPPRKNWNHSELNVMLNPELGLNINSEPHVIKLYFKDIELERDKTNSIICLMENEFSSEVRHDVKFAVLDIIRSKLYYRDKRRTDYMPLIIGEAESFIHMWKRL